MNRFINRAISHLSFRIGSQFNNRQLGRRYLANSRVRPPAWRPCFNLATRPLARKIIATQYLANSLHHLLQWQQTYLDIAILALLAKKLVVNSNSEVLLTALGFKEHVIDSASIFKNLRSIDMALPTRLVKAITQLIALRNHINQQQALANDISRPVKNKEIQAAKFLLTRQLPKLLSKALNISKKEAKTKLAQSKSKLLSDRPWVTIRGQFKYANKIFESTQTPATRLTWAEPSHEIFPHTYQNSGVPSCDKSNTRHAINLWVSELTASDPASPVSKEILFRGVRHGVCAPTGTGLSANARATGALIRAREVITAALFLQPEKLNAALQGETIDLRLTSTSLLTPFGSALFRTEEDAMLDEQMWAWQTLQKTRPLTLEVRDRNNQIQSIKINLDMATFNFGVNELALVAKLGQRKSDVYNERAFKKLLGENLNPKAKLGGWVAEYLSNNPSNAEFVRTLAAQLKVIWANKLHHLNSHEPYLAAKRIALLAHAMGIVPCYNCKSGKDRTALLDLEIKTAATALNLNIDMPQPGKALSSELKNIYGQLVINSGNCEIQQKNTGDAGGNKSIKQFLGITLISAHRGKKENLAIHRGLASLAA